MTSEVRHRHGPAGATGKDARAGTTGAEMLEAAAALRWRRPRLCADLAHQVLEDAAAVGDGPLWLRSAGWYLHGRAATEDAREAAVEVLTAADSFPGGVGIEGADGERLRVELAAIAGSNGDLDQARALIGGRPTGTAGPGSAEVELDRAAVLVRCALAEPGGDVEDLRRSVEGIGGRLRAEPAALADLLVGSIHRSREDRRAAVASALSGLANLGWTPQAPDAHPTSEHLAAALFSQWITALLDGGSSREVRSAVRAVRDQQEQVGTGRQGVLLRLTLARAVPDTPERTAAALRDVAEHAALAGTPSLEAACRATQAEVHEGVGEFREALAALRAGMAAERVDRARARRFRDAMTALGVSRAGGSVTGGHTGTGTAGAPAPELGRRTDATPDDPAVPGGATPEGAVPTPEPRAGLVRADPVRVGAARVRTGIRWAERPTPRPRGGAGDAVVLPAPGPSQPGRHGDPGGGGRHAGPGRAPVGGPATDDGPDTRAGELPGTAAATAAPAEDAARPVNHLLDWAERSWYRPGRSDAEVAGGAPLADALIEELRTAASGPAPDEPGPAPVQDGAGADGHGAGPDGDGAAPPPQSERREPWAALLPGARLVESESEPDGRPGLDGDHGAVPGRDPAPTGAPGDRSPEERADPGAPAVGPVRDTGPVGGQAADVGEHLVVLSLVQGDQPVRHRAAAETLQELAGRAQRLVPPRAQIQVRDAGPGVDPLDDRAGERAARIEVTLPDADRVTATWWAQSLVGYVAARVGRNGLPRQSGLRSQVFDAAGPVGAVVVRDLTGPDRPADGAGASGSEALAQSGGSSVVAPGALGDPPDVAPAAGGGASGRHGGPVPWAAGAVVHPGSGGRRRRDSPRPEHGRDGGAPELHEAPLPEVARFPGTGVDRDDVPGVEAVPGVSAGPGEALEGGLPEAGDLPVSGVGEVVAGGVRSGDGERTGGVPAGSGEPLGIGGSAEDGARTGSGEPAGDSERTGDEAVEPVSRTAPAVSAPEPADEDERAARVAWHADRRRARRAQGEDRSAERGSGRTGNGAVDGDGARETGGARATDATDIPDDLGLAELLAGALAAYRDI